MGSAKSSFHISDEFNGKGKKIYLRASEFNTYEKLPQGKKVRRTPQFTQMIQKAEGAMPVINVVNGNANLSLKAIGAMACVGKVAVTKDGRDGKCLVNFNVSRVQLTSGGYLHRGSQKK